MTPAPDRLCMVGQDMFDLVMTRMEQARASRHKQLGTDWKWLAEYIHKGYLEHIKRCRTCKGMITR